MLNIEVKELIWSRKNTQQIIWWLSINSKVKVIPSKVNKKMEENIKKKKKKKKKKEFWIREANSRIRTCIVSKFQDLLTLEI